MTPSELKYHVEQSTDTSFFFTRNTMRFFGDTMSNYGVRSATIKTNWDDNGNWVSDNGRIVEVWELYRKHPVKHGLKSSTYFDKVTFNKVSIAHSTL